MTTLLFNKPYDVVTGFTVPSNAHEQQRTLADFISIRDVWPIGRLDRDSEGLLMLSNEATIRARLLDPNERHQRTYCAQVEGEVTSEALAQLARGVVFEQRRTRPARTQRIEQPSALWDRHPPVRERKAIPTSWLELSITEGRNRQVRKMTAAVGYPTLRLIRRSILQYDVFERQIAPGEFQELTRHEESQLRLKLLRNQ